MNTLLMPLIMGAGAVALALSKKFAPFQFPKFDPKEVIMLTEKQKKRLPKYARDAIDRLEAALSEANVAHATAVEQGTAEVRRLEEKVKTLSQALNGEPGDITIRRGASGKFFASARVSEEFLSTYGYVRATRPTPHAALSAVLRGLGQLALNIPSMSKR